MGLAVLSSLSDCSGIGGSNGRTSMAAPSVESREEARRWALSKRHSVNVSARHPRQLLFAGSAQQVQRRRWRLWKLMTMFLPNRITALGISRKVALRTPELRMFTPPVLDTALVTPTHDGRPDTLSQRPARSPRLHRTIHPPVPAGAPRDAPAPAEAALHLHTAHPAFGRLRLHIAHHKPPAGPQECERRQEQPAMAPQQSEAAQRRGG